jgi:translation initiation factor 2 subunit 3
LVTGGTNVKEVTPGGSMGVLTKLDPGIVKSDSLAGNVLGLVGKLPEILYNVRLQVHLLERVVGSKEDLIVEPVKMAEILMLNVNSAATVGFVTKLSKNEVDCRLKIPICAEHNSRVTISRRIGNRFRLIGYGILKK